MGALFSKSLSILLNWCTKIQNISRYKTTFATFKYLAYFANKTVFRLVPSIPGYKSIPIQVYHYNMLVL